VGEVGEAQGRWGSVFAACFGEACEFGVGGGDENDFGGRLAKVDGFVIINGAWLGVQEVHFGVFC
jgi:hypothetical protein